ncbi:N-acyl homoserine lactone hydrolase [Lachnospiraceae bacterium PF1-21]|uniref:N-acyl homoserine lactonase family protein n=1 Tax=Ohessyouella blattaphilus TaxID=2949333 RepID=UPI003E2997E9
MNKWIVKAIQVGSIQLDRSAMTHYKGKGEQITVPIWCAGATDGKHKVLVDTGIRDLIEYQKAEPGVRQTPEQDTTVAVKQIMGWEPDDVDIVINTHLHCDHCGSNSKFKNSKFYIQKSEWEAAFAPYAPEAPFYDEICFNKQAVNYFQWNFLEGDAEILPGLRVITTPGHTRGHQSVLFNTEHGVLCVTGDICNVADNLNENLEPNIVVMVPETYESFKKIRQVAHYILPGHEPAVINGSDSFITVL